MNDRCIEIEELAKVNQGQIYDKINQICKETKRHVKQTGVYLSPCSNFVVIHYTGRRLELKITQ